MLPPSPPPPPPPPSPSPLLPRANRPPLLARTAAACATPRTRCSMRSPPRYARPRKFTWRSPRTLLLLLAPPPWNSCSAGPLSACPARPPTTPPPPPPPPPLPAPGPGRLSSPSPLLPSATMCSSACRDVASLTAHRQSKATMRIVLYSSALLCVMLYCSRGDKITVCAHKMYPVASVALLVALCSQPRLSSRLCRHRRCLNLAPACTPRPAPNTSLIASPRTSLLPTRPRGLRYCHRHRLHGELLIQGYAYTTRGIVSTCCTGSQRRRSDSGRTSPPSSSSPVARPRRHHPLRPRRPWRSRGSTCRRA